MPCVTSRRRRLRLCPFGPSSLLPPQDFSLRAPTFVVLTELASDANSLAVDPSQYAYTALGSLRRS